MKKLFASLLLLGFSASSLFLAAQQPGQKKVATTTKDPIVVINTDYGVIKIRLYNETPQHRDNFLKLIKKGYYNDLLFHRISRTVMIQGGDPDSKGAVAGVDLGNGGPGYTIPAEIIPSFFHKKGALAAARQPDRVNPNKASSGSQFYIVHGKTYTDEELNHMERRYRTSFTAEQRKAYKTVGGAPMLDNEYTIFGEVIEGLDVIDKIASVKTGKGERPVEDVKMRITLN